ncbi:hypothetical protein HB847_07970 [Listeria booriae]|uniref:Phosphoribosyl-AMP cyclohydrolase n=2 Tax=Listeria TaxID=1637 RepID=A0A841Y6R4_9LIST|nr:MULTISPECIES: hypothetical protein [Listeria]EUJ42387.1 hypothetical protein PRIP_16632 [Listeria riparia FSL S10-1204]MBC1372308.1 hypothetical protein [Listeria booriae]
MSTITEKEIQEAQNAWGNAIIEIGNRYRNQEDYQAYTKEVVPTLYAFGERDVLFKPTRASVVPFRTNLDEALSYFAGSGVVAEDVGFALQLWHNIRFENFKVIHDGNTAFAMGHYFFTDYNSYDELKVEYTMGYYRNEEGALKLFVHHSSFPFVPNN